MVGERLRLGAPGFSPIREELAYPFEPPLQSVEEVSKRFDALRGEALRPAFDALLASQLIFLATCLLGAHFTSWQIFDWVRALALDQDTKTLCSGSDDKTVKVWTV
mgnify:CR=1 FL=1